MTTLDEAVALAEGESGLAVVSTVRENGTVQASLVNVGAVVHPESGQRILAFVTYGKVKLANLRARPALAVTFRDGWRWATVEGLAELVGPDDAQTWSTTDGLRLLLREVFAAAGGSHDDWDEYDRVMSEQRRTVVLMTPARVYSNG